MTPALLTTTAACSQAARPAPADAVHDRQRVLGWIARCMFSGSTDEEGQEALGLGGSTYRPRRLELLQAGQIFTLGATRKTRSGRKAVVWVAR